MSNVRPVNPANLKESAKKEKMKPMKQEGTLLLTRREVALESETAKTYADAPSSL